MTIYAVMMPTPQPRLAQEIQSKFPNDHLKISDTQWLVSGAGTALEIVGKLGIYDVRNPAAQTGNAIVLAVSSYHGRAPTPVWDWVKSKLENPGG